MSDYTEIPEDSGPRGVIGSVMAWPLKTKIVAGSVVAGVLLLGFFVASAAAPRKGNILYGICGVFLEQLVDYPETIRYSWVEQYPRGVRIYYSQMDAFGQDKQDMIECLYRTDPVRGLVVDKVQLNRLNVDPARIERFNVSLKAIVESDPDLTLPPPQPDMLRGIR